MVIWAQLEPREEAAITADLHTTLEVSVKLYTYLGNWWIVSVAKKVNNVALLINFLDNFHCLYHKTSYNTRNDVVKLIHLIELDPEKCKVFFPLRSVWTNMTSGSCCVSWWMYPMQISNFLNFNKIMCNSMVLSLLLWGAVDSTHDTILLKVASPCGSCRNFKSHPRSVPQHTSKERRLHYCHQIYRLPFIILWPPVDQEPACGSEQPRSLSITSPVFERERNSQTLGQHSLTQ